MDNQFTSNTSKSSNSSNDDGSVENCIITDKGEQSSKRQKIMDDIREEYKLGDITTVDDLLKLFQLYYDDQISEGAYNEILSNIEYEKIFNLLDVLLELKDIIGMQKLKENVISLIRFYITGIIKDNDMKHMVIYGPPGCGKTTVLEILAKILKKLGILSKGHIKKVKATDLIGKYVGHTGPKTLAILESCIGGILVIDEAYSLGNDRTRNTTSDGFSKEALDVINQFLSENKDDFICIIAGYKEEIERCFFAYNPGLERRFPYRFTIESYSPQELKEIFIHIVKRDNWEICDDAIEAKFFLENKNYFEYQGGDLETLFHYCRIANSKRIFCMGNSDKMKLNSEDIKNGFQLFINGRELETKKEEISPSISHLYL